MADGQEEVAVTGQAMLSILSPAGLALGAPPADNEVPSACLPPSPALGLCASEKAGQL